ncbi:MULTISPECIES: tRNA (adenosine(37)-N6)-threonylcarbamoyltransferase complex transferase subunit TsaD [Desulfococcus]|jgi:N6-L-threonylcarbamoyladenine synthase|uniref:tRNA N6-adenosine threonylcarbamoyltransferase n=1 Tax=Desulfococcus multivorans DSM 2059 TaxID=1121405 RepID=S7TDL1_DESML|nr:tRNA (adenosine(37)-N6)-threonylcarbamoyltransferase complex transferase subunit TsaD [Desulfococcus multivorans]AOY60665.1 Gcp: O-sialoglycoprotein endopeptidase [Desulfococcus multivorans]AQV03150.1 tRNA (adenosine(37)-N6)-threonylcarbamoyltransferase complex transferase subunit TsaD [Desulfococcus multivorans]EPR34675.1 O-sialoglycoprotein endopeptidase [Desulfococcus multivorans DSM 2059]MDX9819139.1 tRNA (adenosine(37)-N6)-threonylcarbamoyltransferase complex transferase subunit TsaD [D
MIILGIETSCDETAAALVEDGRRILSSIVASQVDIHHRYGGVVPELASRKHLESIVPVTLEALEDAQIDFSRLDGIAVTQGPGLVGALLVGFSFAKGLARMLKVPWRGVNHLEGHLHSVFLSDAPPPFPFVALLASGGHTSIYYVTGPTCFQLLGQTRDDAAGEAFDKVSKMLGLGYPGGAVLGRLAARGNPEKIKFPRAYLDRDRFDFSFSGLKTAVNQYIKRHGDDLDGRIADIAAGFQEAVVDVLVEKVIRAAETTACRDIAMVGGVAANERLRCRLLHEGTDKKISVHVPPLDFCGDNAAMIAAVGYHYIRRGDLSQMTDDVYSRLKRP